MAMRFTVEGGEVRLLPQVGSDEGDEWPEPIRTYLIPPSEDLAEHLVRLEEGVPLVLEVASGASLSLDDLVGIVRLAGDEGHDVIVLSGRLQP